MQRCIHINIGSNRGHRRALIERAVTAVSLALPGRVSLSEIIETEPWGFDSPNPFLNIAMMIEIDDSQLLPFGETDNGLLPACETVNGQLPSGEADDVSFALEVHRRLQAVEKSIDSASHRGASGEYVDRAIDIDLIAVDSIVVDTAELTLPHPRMHLRDFVLRPLLELAPSWRHPLLGHTPAQLLARL